MSHLSLGLRNPHRNPVQLAHSIQLANYRGKGYKNYDTDKILSEILPCNKIRLAGLHKKVNIINIDKYMALKTSQKSCHLRSY